MASPIERTLTRGLLGLYLMHTLAVPVIALGVICAGDVHLHRNLAQLLGVFPAVLFLAVTAMWTELPGRLGKAALLALIVPVEVGIGTWWMGRDPGFYFVEAFFVDIAAMGVAFVAMAGTQLRGQPRPIASGLLLLVLALAAFGGPVWDAYADASWRWRGALVGMIGVDAWAYMYVLGSKAVPFKALGSRRKGLLDRVAPDRFVPVSLGASDVVVVPVVIGGLAVWAILPFVFGGPP